MLQAEGLQRREREVAEEDQRKGPDPHGSLEDQGRVFLAHGDLLQVYRKGGRGAVVEGSQGDGGRDFEPQGDGVRRQ